MKTLNVKDDIYTVLNCSKCSNLGLEKCCIENMRCSMGIDTYMILKKPDHCQLAKIRSMTVKEIQFNHKGSPELNCTWFPRSTRSSSDNLISIILAQSTLKVLDWKSFMMGTLEAWGLYVSCIVMLYLMGELVYIWSCVLS